MYSLLEKMQACMKTQNILEHGHAEAYCNLTKSLEAVGNKSFCSIFISNLKIKFYRLSSCEIITFFTIAARILLFI